MVRYSFILAAAFCAGASHAEERSPEELLPSTTQLYVRWDGVAAHRNAYAKSARGKVFAGESGKAADSLLEQLNRKAKLALVGDQLLQGTLPKELEMVRADLKQLLQVPGLLSEKGLVIGLEIRPPIYDLRTLYDLARGDAKTRENLTMPQVQVTLVVPDAASRPELTAAVRMLGRTIDGSIKERVIDNQKITSIEKERDPAQLAFWAEGKHAVIVIGNPHLEMMVKKVHGSRAGITENPLFKKLGQFREFRAVTRGFIDVSGALSPFQQIAGLLEPRLWPALDAAGLTGVKCACFWEGFEGEESRGVIEIEFLGERRGLTRMFFPVANGQVRPAPLTMKDLPLLPADLTRFAAARLDPRTMYELFPLVAGSYFGASNDEDDRRPPEDKLRSHREKFLHMIDEYVGLKMNDVFSTLDDRIVTYQAPSDGILGVGQVIALGVKDEKALRRCLKTLVGKLEQSTRDQVVVKSRDCLGVEVFELIFKERSPVTISWAICDGWLVAGFQPQPVRGFIYRARGKLPAWKPDPRTAATLTKVPGDRCVIQVADPRASVQWMLSVAPIVAGLAEKKGDPVLGPGIFPIAGEVNQHLFPNVCWCRDDGKVMRWESRDSLWLPLEFMGPEFLGFYLAALGVSL